MILAACANQPAPAGPATAAAPPPTLTDKVDGVRSSTVTVTVIALSDFHGWLKPLQPRRDPRFFGGIENLAAMWRGREGVTGKTAILVDNGDMWTGQTEATLLKGEPVVRIYNELGFAAVNVANHEFDFGPDVLRSRVHEARFPFLGANVFNAGTDDQPDFLQPWTIVTRQGVKVGILGLCYINTPQTTLAKNVADLEFRPYAVTLRRELPKLREAGAEAIVLLLHDEVSIAAEVFETNADLDVDLVVAGQNHRPERTDVRGIPIVNPGPFGRSYTRFEVSLDSASREVVAVRDVTIAVTGEVAAPPYPAPREVTAIVEEVKNRAKALTSAKVGVLGKPLPTGTFAASPLGHFVVDSWLAAFPKADVAIVNFGGLRQSIAAGDVTLGDLYGALPFENNIQQIQITGAELKSQLVIDHPVVGGLTWRYRERDGQRMLVSATDRHGQPIDDTRRYRVLIIDFMYSGGDGYTFSAMSANPIDSGISWREPLIRALRRAAADNKTLMPAGGVRAQRVP